MYEAMHLARCLATRKAPVRREYPALNDTVVGTCIDPNKFSEVNSEHNLEELNRYAEKTPQLHSLHLCA